MERIEWGRGKKKKKKKKKKKNRSASLHLSTSQAPGRRPCAVDLKKPSVSKAIYTHEEPSYKFCSPFRPVVLPISTVHSGSQEVKAFPHAEGIGVGDIASQDYRRDRKPELADALHKYGLSMGAGKSIPAPILIRVFRHLSWTVLEHVAIV